MDTAQILTDLRAQRDRIDTAITALESLTGSTASTAAKAACVCCRKEREDYLRLHQARRQS